ncbi:MAG: GxxExxY protein [bacterium]
MTDAEAKELADIIRQASLQLHTFLKWGHLEKVYENGLAHRLFKKGIRVEQQVRISVKDEDGTVLGDYVADIVVGGKMILEIKACESLEDIHTAQVLGYLRATGLRHGMLINFGAPVLQIKKLVL